ncbi:hypothetical protein QEN19_003803 [Hanseniaspora menglaensis]
MAATRKQRNAANLRKRNTEVKKSESPVTSDSKPVPYKNNSASEKQNVSSRTPSPALLANTRSVAAAAAAAAAASDLLLAESIGSRSIRQKKVTINAKMQVMSSAQWISKYGKDYGNQPPKSILEQPSVNSDHKEVLSVETGVEKHEEKEEHLKKILQNKDASKHDYIPTPDASKRWNAYNDLQISKFENPEHYIVSSATLEECFGIEYLMDEVDEEFLKKECLQDIISDDHFELLCQIFEEIVIEHQPFLSVEPDSILTYEDLFKILDNKINGDIPLLKASLCSTSTNEEKGINIALKKELLKDLKVPNYIKLIWESDTTNKTLSPNSEKSMLNIWRSHGEIIFNHWRERKIQSKGDTIRPHLRFEKNGEKNDNDPYICFRRREIRQVRKTRKMDKINSQKLYILMEQLERSRDIINKVNEREVVKQEKIYHWENIYRQRKRIRDNKIPLDEKNAFIMIDENNVNTLSKKKQFVNSAGSTSDSLIEALDFDLRRRLNLELEEIRFIKDNKIEELKEKISKKLQQKQAAQKKKQQDRAKKKQLKLEEDRQLKKKKTGKGFAGSDFSFSTNSSTDKKLKVLKELDPNNVGNGYNQYQQHVMRSNIYTEAKNNSIPEHDLKNVEYILNEKQKQTKQFFEDSMYKRFLEDSNLDYINFTDCTLNPNMDFNIPSNMLNTGAVLSSSLSASSFDVFNTGYNPIFDPSKDESFVRPKSYSSDLSQYYNKKALTSNVKIINSDGEILNPDLIDSTNEIKSESNPLHTLFEESTPMNSEENSFDHYIMPEVYQMDAEYKHASMKEQTGRSCSIEKQHTKELPFLNRKRINRFNETFIDKQYNHLNQIENKETDILSEFFDFENIEAQENVNVGSVYVNKDTEKTLVIDAYDSEKDSFLRMSDRWKFDVDHYIHDPPLIETSSVLNSIPRETQVIRFSTMLGTKASDKMKEVQHQYRRDLINKVKKDQLRRQRYVDQVRKKQKQMLQLQLQKQQQDSIAKKTNETSTFESGNSMPKKAKKQNQTPSKQQAQPKQKMPTPTSQATKKQEHS